jgi:hypothetical protein
MSGKTKTGLIVTVLLLLTIAAATSAQNSSSQNPEQQTIVLPLELVAGQPATLAVLSADGRIEPGVKVVLSNGEMLATDESGRAHFLLPPDTGVTFARIAGTEVREAADVLPHDAMSGGLQVTKMPRLVSLENHFAISGMGFQGDADQNRVEVGDKRILILASSPVQLIVMPPAKAVPGPASLVMMEGTTEVATNLNFVDITMPDASGAPIRRGKKSTIVLRVLGTTEPVDLLIRNLGSSVVQFPHGNEERVHTAGGLDNSALIELKGIGAGSFSYEISLEDASAGVNVPVARDFLEAAQKAAQLDMANHVAAILNGLHGDKMNAVKVRNEVDEISNQGSEDFQALMRAARRALSGE